MRDGELAAPHPTLAEIRGRVQAALDGFDPSYKRLLNPHVYKVSITAKYRALTLDLIKNFWGE
jgi:nicotinate phosphoribosyltransferase